MKGKIIAILLSLLVIAVIVTGSSMANEYSQGPAENSGDGIPDGSGFDESRGTYGDSDSGQGHMEPAPNSGDGIPDGPGW